MAAFIERLKNWKTTVAGFAGAGVIIVLAQSFHCQLPTDWGTWAMATIPLVIGSLASDSTVPKA